jgi:zinc transport system ATP-binding protein
VQVRRGREEVLQGVSLQVARGSCHCLVGPNGAGKSTLLGAVLGQLPFSGRIQLRWRGNQRLGYVPQRAALDTSVPLTALEFLALQRSRRPIFLGISRATRHHLLQLLASGDLERVADTPIAGLSGGELQRLLFLNAIDPLPELLLLDEPTSGLDVNARRAFEALLQRYRAQQALTIFMVSHDPAQVQRLADHVTILERAVIADGPPGTVLTAPTVDAAAPAAPADPIPPPEQGRR